MRLGPAENLEQNSKAAVRRLPIARIIAAGAVAFALSLAACLYLASKFVWNSQRRHGAHSAPSSSPVRGGESRPKSAKPPASLAPSTPGSSPRSVHRAHGRTREGNPLLSPHLAEASGESGNVY